MTREAFKAFVNGKEVPNYATEIRKRTVVCDFGNKKKKFSVWSGSYLHAKLVCMRQYKVRHQQIVSIL